MLLCSMLGFLQEALIKEFGKLVKISLVVICLRISMRMITLTPKISSVETKNGVALSVSGVAQVLNKSIVLEFWPAQVLK